MHQTLPSSFSLWSSEEELSIRMHHKGEDMSTTAEARFPEHALLSCCFCSEPMKGLVIVNKDASDGK